MDVDAGRYYEWITRSGEDKAKGHAGMDTQAHHLNAIADLLGINILVMEYVVERPLVRGIKEQMHMRGNSADPKAPLAILGRGSNHYVVLKPKQEAGHNRTRVAALEAIKEQEAKRRSRTSEKRRYPGLGDGEVGDCIFELIDVGNG